MVDHNLVLNVGDTLTVTVADPNDRSTTAPRNSFSNYNTNAPPALFETAAPNNDVNENGGKIDKVFVTAAPNNNVNENGGKIDKVYKNVGGRRKTRKAGKKVGGAKRALSGFMRFSQKMRPEVMRENPGIAFGDVGRRLGEKWRSLSAAEKARY